MGTILKYKSRMLTACNLWAGLSATAIGAKTDNSWLWIASMIVAIVNFWIVLRDTERAVNG